MIIEAKIIADSISETDNRLTTIQVQLPKVLLAELNTHRVFSRNYSSSRAIPTQKFTEMDYFEPLFYGKNQPGMQAKKEEIEEVELARHIWFNTMQHCKEASEKLAELGLHKQWANRLNDWWVMARGIVSSTEWDNFLALRDHEDAQPEIALLAQQIKQALKESNPKILRRGEWHLPYVTYDELSCHDNNTLIKISAARCCRASYNKHDGTSPGLDEDLKLFDRLSTATPPHYSPLEHQATPDIIIPGSLRAMASWKYPHLHANFVGWCQFRKMHEGKYALDLPEE